MNPTASMTFLWQSNSKKLHSNNNFIFNFIIFKWYVTLFRLSRNQLKMKIISSIISCACYTNILEAIKCTYMSMTNMVNCLPINIHDSRFTFEFHGPKCKSNSSNHTVPGLVLKRVSFSPTRILPWGLQKLGPSLSWRSTQTSLTTRLTLRQ